MDSLPHVGAPDRLAAAGRVPAGAHWFTAPVLAAAVAVIGIVAVHASTAASIVSIWERSETFAHGFVIVPICLWLIWRKREALAEISAAPWWPGVLAVLAAGAMWFVMSVADVLGLKQFSLAFMVQAAFVTVVGLSVARALAFPLAFLLFAIPVGEIFVPTLIEWTANFTVWALRFSGVPVYREANHFVIPSGTWSVVEACSGIRYIIASVMVGTIYAAVAYRSTRRRALFMAAAIVTPIVANWLRAYGIVMLGHLSGNRIAIGFDHIIYGWLFFGLVMLLVFWIGSYWQEEPAASPEAPAAERTGVTPDRAATASTASFFAAAFACIAVAGIWIPLEARVASATEANAPEVAVLPARDGWVASPDAIADWKPDYRGFAWDLRQAYRKGDREVGVYIAYYRNQTKGRELVTSGNQLTNIGDIRWKPIARAADAIDWNGESVSVERTRLSGPGDKLDVVRLFWVDGQVTASEYVAKARLAWSRLRGRGDDSALIVVYAPRPAGSPDAAESLREFTRSMSAGIARALAAVRGEPG